MVPATAALIIVGVLHASTKGGRRTDVVGIFPDDASVVRLVSMLAIEANDEWLVGRSYISQKSMKLLGATSVSRAMIKNKILRR